MSNILVLYENHSFQPHIEYSFRILFSLLGLDIRIARLISGWEALCASDDLVVSYGHTLIRAPAQAQIHIYESNLFGPAYLQQASLPVQPVQWVKGIPALFRGRERVPGSVAADERLVVSDLDLVASAFFMVSRYDELFALNRHSENGPSDVCASRDQHGRFPALASLAYREGFLRRPIVHDYAELLWSWILQFDLGFQRRRPWGDKDFAVCVTHDVDSVRRYSYPPVVTVAKALKTGDPRRAFRIGREYGRVMMGRQSEPYDTFDYMLAQEKGHGLVPTFYFMAGRYGRKGPRCQDYRLDDENLVATVRRLENAGCEIGLHPSYDAFQRPDLLWQEKQTLEQTLGHPVVGMRQHFLRFEAPQSWRTWEQAGFTYDSTLAFSREEGFRAGICVPFRPFDLLENRELALWEVPLTVMDGMLFEHQGLDATEAQQRFNELVDTVEAVGGLFVFLWHNSFLDELVYPGVCSAYERLVGELAQRPALGMTVQEAVARHAAFVRREG